ncbi:ATP-binding protein [Streptomyces sp. NPDC050704]|uniref:ATP-binding protein n=1 Tax=Streptomyces sp. NPDC050704 TaxID=3157219 RepID=UPI00342225C3
MTAFQAHRRPSRSSRHGADRDAPTGLAWAGEAAQTVPITPAVVPAAPVTPAAVAVSQPRVLRTVVPAEPWRASGVRRMIAERLAPLRLSSEQLDNAVLATDELFTNAVEHGSPDPGDTVTVTVECTAHEVCVTVTDRSPRLPRCRTAGVAEESGRGLAIVAALTDDWGTAPPHPGEVGKRVWFTLEVRGTS